MRLSSSSDLLQNLDKTLRKTYILNTYSLAEKRGYFLIPEAGNAATDACNVKEQFGMLLCKGDEVIYVRFDGLYTTLHSRNGVTLTTKANPAAHDGAELLPGYKCGSSAMHSFQVAPEDENFIGLQLRYHVRGEIRTLCSIVRFHSVYEDTKNSWKSRGDG